MAGSIKFQISIDISCKKPDILLDVSSEYILVELVYFMAKAWIVSLNKIYCKYVLVNRDWIVLESYWIILNA